MGEILRNWRIGFAVLFSGVLIVGAYVLAREFESPSLAQASAEAALLQAIASRDSDSDGLPDWEEALYGTDPRKVDTNSLGMTDGEAVEKGLIVPKAIRDITVDTSQPADSGEIDYGADGLTPPSDNTLTSAFANNFFELYVAAKAANNGVELTSEQINALALRAMELLTQSVFPSRDFKKLADIKVSASGSEALIAFAVAAEAVFQKNTSEASQNEIFYLQSAVEKNDTSALESLASMSKSYRDGAVGISALPVPRELVPAHLLLVNSMMRMSQIIGDFARLNADPLTAMVSLQQYVGVAQALGKAFADIADVYGDAGVSLSAGTPGASFVNLYPDTMARLQAANEAP